MPYLALEGSVHACMEAGAAGHAREKAWAPISAGSHLFSFFVSKDRQSEITSPHAEKMVGSGSMATF